MKKIITLLLLTVVCCTSCRYEEGPGISFTAPEYRIIANWTLDKVYMNNNRIEETSTIANRPTNYYQFYNDGVMEVLTFYNNTIRYSNYGFWSFQDNCKSLAIDFNLINKKYTYIARLKYLSKQQMIYEYDDESGNHWRLEFSCYSRVN
ncbi:MAG: hypothetical protein MJZ72_06905 [Bacteroidales bacterium]|nr:hypothetical protein [Bacteroidales bacterium]